MTIRSALNDTTLLRRVLPARAMTPVVYLVESDRPTLDHLSEQLTGCGYGVQAFETFEQYRDFARCPLPSCLIIDADASATATMQLQAELESGSQVPVILTSANPDIATVVRSIRAGALDYLMKPLSRDSLVGAVRAAIEQDHRRAAARAARARVASCMARLTPREAELLPLLVSGLLNKQSAARMGISEITIKVHRRHIMEKLQAASLADLVRMTAHLDLHLIERGHTPPVL